MPPLSTHSEPDQANETLEALLARIRGCRHCTSVLPHEPRPFVQAAPGARLLIIGQAPGSKVHASGIGWDDASGDRLRDWLGLDKARFYDPELVAQMPSGFCYPGKGDGGDLPPRPECAPLWHAPLLERLPNLRLVLLVGRYAQVLYLSPALRRSMTETVRRWQDMPDPYFPLPHPAWRSRLWMAKHPWFEAEVLPALRKRIAEALA
ncbi:uracil-DNA glycosylase family protein [Novosphingobium aquimarinum]|uniref:uracil-DNA glycosylase family protein n=1 Tax=Novosphingobium aquimarinum TaxID=2682494 RepID=UPI0012EB45DB|nr:uracil-DNA glycosylase family protein [Novosphingobium aquimarinum]